MAAVADGYVSEAPPALVVHAVEPPATIQMRPAPRGAGGASTGTDSAKDGGAGSDADQSSDPEPDKEQEDDNDDVNDENAAPDEASGGDRKPRRELPPATVKILKDWMLSSEHIKHPYPTDDDKKKLLELTGINMKQLTNWFTNARKRIWKPMMRREHSRQLHSSLTVDAAEPASSYPQHPASGSSRGYNEYTHDQGAAPPPHPMMERRLSLPSTSEFDPRYPPQHGHHHHGGQLASSTFSRTSIHPLASTSGPSPYGHPSYQSPLMSYGGYGGLPRLSAPTSFFPPRSNRSASESVAHHQHSSHTLGHRVSSSTQPPSQAPLPPRLERTNSDAAKASPPLKRERPGSSSGDLDGEGSDAQLGKDKRLRRSALLPPHVIKTLKDWMLSPEHVEHPYPTDAEKKQLCEDTGLDLCQLNNWFANNRKRLWKPTMANRSKALYTNENIRSLIYKTENDQPVQINSTAPPSSSTTPTGFKSDRVFHVNASLARPVAADTGDGSRHDLPSTSHLAMPRYPFPGSSLVPGVAPREGRSHTLDMGSFRRSRMNFQDVLNASAATPRWSPDVHENSLRREGAGRTLPSLHAPPSSSSSAGFH